MMVSELSWLVMVKIILLFVGLNDIPCLQEASIGVSINAKS